MREVPHEVRKSYDNIDAQGRHDEESDRLSFVGLSIAIGHADGDGYIAIDSYLGGIRVVAQQHLH